MRPLSRRLALLVAALAIVLGPGCLSPTLPLPPPSRPTVEGPDPQGMVTVSGFVRGNSTVFVENANTGRGVFQRVGSDGQYSLVLAAETDHELWIWYTHGTDESPITIILVRDPNQ